MAYTSLKLALLDVARVLSKGKSLLTSVHYITDRLLYPFLRGDASNQLRQLTLKGDLLVNYRRNRGDIWTIREVFFDECYELPFESQINTFVDLGANIGLTTLWIHQKYSPKICIALEPEQFNYELAKKNFDENRLEVTLINAAIGDRDAEVSFAKHTESNMGRVNAEGSAKVQMMSMASLLEKLPHNAQIDLLKVDIEGGEQQLFGSNTAWLDRVNAIIAEFHPHFIECEPIYRTLKEHGFARCQGRGQMDCFIREANPCKTG